MRQLETEDARTAAPRNSEAKAYDEEQEQMVVG